MFSYQLITNGTVVLQNDPTLVYGTWALVIITLFGIIITAILTKKSLNLTQDSLQVTRDHVDAIRYSNELAEKQLKHTLKPKLELIKTKSSLQGKPENFVVRVYCTIKNSGNVDIKNMNRIVFESNNHELRHLLQEYQNYKKSIRSIGTIPQNQNKDFFDDIPWKSGQQKTNWIIWLEYEYLNVKENAVIIFQNLSAGMEPIPYQWKNNENVVEAEKERNDLMSGKTGA